MTTCLITRLQKFTSLVGNAHYTIPRSVGMGEFFNEMQKYLQCVQAQGGICYILGNGGSAGIASHVASEFLKGLKLRAMTLIDPDLLTCIGNDIGYESSYALPLKILIKKEDMLIAISSSGQSRNILEAVNVARGTGARVMTASGGEKNNPLRGLGNLNLWLDSSESGIVETGHFFLLHAFIDEYKRMMSE